MTPAQLGCRAQASKRASQQANAGKLREQLSLLAGEKEEEEEEEEETEREA